VKSQITVRLKRNICQVNDLHIWNEYRYCFDTPQKVNAVQKSLQSIDSKLFVTTINVE